MESFEVLKEAVEPLGAKAIAADMHISAALVYKWCQRPPEDDNDELGSGARNPLDRAAQLYKLTRQPEIVNWLCHQADGFFVPNPKLDLEAIKANPLHFIERTQGMIHHFSSLLNVLTESINDDGRIDVDEAKRIRRVWEVLKCQVEELVVGCEKGFFDSER